MKIQSLSKFLIKNLGIVSVTAGLLVSLSSLAHEVRATPAVKKVVVTPTGNIVQVAVANGSFKTLVAAIKAAGLVDTLSGKDPFTVFAPTDAAFAKLPEGTVATLLKPENKSALVKILTYHVIAGKVLAKDITSGSVLVPTVEGSSLKVTKTSKNVVIDNSKVTAADVKASNGVIHVIDEVLIPPGLR